MIFRSFRVRKSWEASAERFEISKGKLLEAVSETDYVNSFTVSPEDIDIIYSGDKELINKTFADELVNGYADKIYSASGSICTPPTRRSSDLICVAVYRRGESRTGGTSEACKKNIFLFF